MFCNNCGTAVPDSDSFCSICGQPLKANPIIAGDIGYGSVPPPVMPGKPVKKPGFKPRHAIIACAIVAVIAGVYFGGRAFLEKRDYQNTLSKAEEAADSGDYDDAARLYRDASDERPNDRAARDRLEATLSEALEQGIDEAKELVSKGRVDDAIRMLEELPIRRDDKLYDEYWDYVKALTAKPSLLQIDSSEFPEIHICIETEYNDAESDGISVSDNGKSVDAEKIGHDGRVLVFSYTAEDSPDGGEYHEVSLDLTIGEFTFPLSGDYTAPVLQDAEVTLVSTDFSDYPTVRAFLRVEDVNGEPVENLGPKSFTITESVSGGVYVAREVTAAEQMITADGKHGINIALVADKSDSIGGDMSKIKTVMREFVGSIALSAGDRAELIAFDDVPQLMCTFTDDASLLNNGIDNMATDGMTAFYDAVYQGVRNAALQGDARCVIAFTDGEDNMSRHKSGDVIRFANEKQVPLYIIGVGNKNSSSHDTMRKMANDTHGRYWYIDDLYDLSEIYTQIYDELLGMYVVSYESDVSVDPLSARGLEVAMRGGGFKGDVSAVFTPAKTAGNGGGSRYEIFLEDVSWEEASERCLERGGHLVTITSKAEEDQIIALAVANGAKYVWLGGYTSYDNYNNVFAHWITGEDFTYQNWMKDEPSRRDRDGTPEWYLMLWETSEAGGWTWNDQRGELVTQFPYYKGKLAYVCEYE